MSTSDDSPQGSNNGFLKVLGRGDILALAFGAMIGFGWITATSGFLEAAGPVGAALAFAIGGVIVALVGLTYAELVTAMPKAGGEHHYAMRALGAKGAFVASWAMALGYISVVAFEAVAIPQTIVDLFPNMLAGHMWTVADYDVYATWVAVGVGTAVVMTVLNYVGIRPASVFQIIAVLFLLGVGITLLLGAFTGGSTETMRPAFGIGPAGLLTVLVAVPFLFVGFDVIPQSASEIRIPYRQVGRILVVSVLCAAAWYILIMLTVGSSLPVPDLLDADLGTAEAMRALWNSHTMGNLLVLGGIAGLLTSWNAFLIGASRLLYAMSVSGMLPRWFGRMHPRFRTPGNALLFVGGLSVIAPFFGEPMMNWLINAGGMSIVVAYVVVVVSFLVLRRTEPQMPRPFRVSSPRLVGGSALVLSLALGVLYLPGMPASLSWPEEWVIILAWWVIGLPLLLRLPSVGKGSGAEKRLMEAVGRREDLGAEPNP